MGRVFNFFSGVSRIGDCERMDGDERHKDNSREFGRMHA